MAAFYGLSNGDVQGLRRNQSEEEQFPPDNDTVFIHRFDETTNTGVISAWDANSASFRIDGGTVTQNGTPVTFSPPSAVFSALENLQTSIDKLGGGNNDPLTTAELKNLFRVILNDLGRFD